MENKPKTIEELFVEKYEKLEKENEELKESLEINYKREGELIQERDEWKNKYNKLIEKFKEDFGLELRYASAFPGELIICSQVMLWKNSDREKYEHYKNLFNLKEEGENEDEECSEGN